MIHKYPCHQKLWAFSRWTVGPIVHWETYHFIKCLSVYEWAVAWPKRLVKESANILARFCMWSFPGQLRVDCLPFLQWLCRRYFQRFYKQWSCSLLFCKNSTKHLFLEVHTINKQTRRKTKQKTFTWNGDLLLWSIYFYFITFKRKVTGKTFAVVRKTPECFFFFRLYLMPQTNTVISGHHVDFMDIYGPKTIYIYMFYICEHCLETCS